MTEDEKREVDEMIANRLEARALVDIFTEMDERQKEELAGHISRFMFDRQQALRKPENTYTPRWTWDNTDIDHFESTARNRNSTVGHPGPTLPRVINLQGSVKATLDPQDPQQLNVDIRGAAGADCMFDYLVSDCWTGEEGLEVRTLSGCTFKIYSQLFGTGFAFDVAVDDALDRIIYVCAGHSETLTATVDVPGLANEQQIYVYGGSPYRNTINVDLASPDALFTQTANNAGTQAKLIFDGINFVAPSSSTPNIYGPSGGVGAFRMEFWNCNFEGAGIWQYALLLTLTGSATSAGMLFDNCRGTLLAFVIVGSAGADGSGSLIVRDSNFTLERIQHKQNSTDIEGFLDLIMVNNELVVTGASSGTFQAGLTIANFGNNRRIVIANNDINYQGNDALFQFGITGATSGIGDVLVNSNNIYCSTAGATAILWQGAVIITGCSMIGNMFRGPGSGTGVTASGITSVVTSAFAPNGYRSWTTTITSGLATTFPPFTTFDVPLLVRGNADATVIPGAMVIVDATGTETAFYEMRRANAVEARFGLYDTTSPASPFLGNDFYFATDLGTTMVAAFQNDGTKWKVNTNELINGYLRVGATSSFTAPTNTTAGYITGERLFLPNAALSDTDNLAQVNGPVAIGSLAPLRLYDAANTNYVALRAPAAPHATQFVYVLPADAPANGEVLAILSTAASPIITTEWAAAGSGDVATDAIWDAKGDLAVGTGADTAAKLTVGADNTMIMADAAETTGLKYVSFYGRTLAMQSNGFMN